MPCSLNQFEIMTTYEQTEKVETGLDVAIRAEDGRVIAWAYSEEMAKAICDGLNNFWRKSDGEPRCAGCEPLEANDEADSSAAAD